MVDQQPDIAASMAEWWKPNEMAAEFKKQISTHAMVGDEASQIVGSGENQVRTVKIVPPRLLEPMQQL
jgi:hypothetical protein